MSEKYTPEEKLQFRSLARTLMRESTGVLTADDRMGLKSMLRELHDGPAPTNRIGRKTVIHALDTAVTLCRMVNPDRNMLLAGLLETAVTAGTRSIEQLGRAWGDEIASLISGCHNVSSLYERQSKIDSDNYRQLMMTYAKDIRVIIMMIVDNLVRLRAVNHHPDEELVRAVVLEAQHLYSPLSHRLGLYKIKSEMEDLVLKYSNRPIYTRIARGLNEKKAARDAYIAAFIAPVKERLQAVGLRFDIKGRTKSIASIWNKVKKQQVDLDGIYDLFAIRIILDSEADQEKPDCWKAYSVIADMYTPNPARLKDWLSIPKSNGYESLHTTVQGPGGKWVEVQIRTRRMDLIAEKGLAAHWRYKGIKGEDNLDKWMNNIRDILENSGTAEMSSARGAGAINMYDDEVFVFTPKGDLFKLPLGATVLDLAFHIHSGLGSITTGARVNNRNRRINYKLRSGDTVEILTSSTQTPKQDWLSIVVTSKARNKIRSALNENAKRKAEYGKEALLRRARNRKIDLQDSVMQRLIKQLGYKTMTDLYAAIGDGVMEPVDCLNRYEQLIKADQARAEHISAEDFELLPTTVTAGHEDDVLVIGEGTVKGLSYKMAGCCNPIYGDSVVGFISSEGVVKIHRSDCPNARHLSERYPYRIITTRWSGKQGEMFITSLAVTGRDDIGIVTNITSLITKESNVTLRSIQLDTADGLFRGYLSVGVRDKNALTSIIKKIEGIKGVKSVKRVS